ncbi:hypothetical protein OSB04_023636 [Centaurea solstitialis]|uniref:Uncharacterized protein n=1 Tax=Centaurea solstitialis TaxID=347529 RepID=A0AA38SJL4_9ASTR|nr:hypothetical protein OSB04_023636 [Centaurea solstitialis]
MRQAQYSCERKISSNDQFIMSVNLSSTQKTRYTSMKKLLLGLMTTAKKLRHYFESHHIIVVTNYPLKTSGDRQMAPGRFLLNTSLLLQFRTCKFESVYTRYDTGKIRSSRVRVQVVPIRCGNRSSIIRRCTVGIMSMTTIAFVFVMFSE